MNTIKAQTDTIKITSESKPYENNDKKISGIIGIGGSALGEIMFNAGLSFQKNRHIYGVRCIYAKEKLIEGLDFFAHSEPYENISELGFFFGLGKKITNRFFGNIGGGISYVQGEKRGKYVYTSKGFVSGNVDYYEEIQFKSPGLIMDAKITLLLGRYFNLSLHGVADWNLYKSFYGMVFGMGFNIPFNKK